MNSRLDDENSSTETKSFDTDYDKLIVPEKFIRKDESSQFFTKNGIIDFFNDLDNDTNWISLYNNNNLVLHYKKTVRICIN